jgi:hypothetical protein
MFNCTGAAAGDSGVSGVSERIRRVFELKLAKFAQSSGLQPSASAGSARLVRPLQQGFGKVCHVFQRCK